ncbi:hypothetical protein E4U21_002637 [Claviceps maximensis]|nr:hypothetical protein E4U21_002637 [Claviceps maximensis]
MPSFKTWAHSQSLPPAHDPLTTSIIPALLSSISRISTALRHHHHISATDDNTLNPFGDTQLNVDLLAEKIVRDTLAACPAVCTASSEEDPVERRVVHDGLLHDEAPPGDDDTTSASASPCYTVAFDPLDGSSIIGPNWTVGTIIGIWASSTALDRDPATHQVAAILGVYGPRTTALVAIRIPGHPPLCVEVGLAPSPSPGGHEEESDAHNMDPIVIRDSVRFTATAPTGTTTAAASATPKDKETRYFAPANLRAAADDARYWSLVERYIRAGYTLRYSGGLVPDVVHALTKGRGIYLSPVTGKSGAKLRRLYELLPVALVVECAGGTAVDPADGRRVLASAVGGCDERGGLVCGDGQEVELAMEELGRLL